MCSPTYPLSKAAFFCPNCISESSVKLGPYGEPTECSECGNHRVIAKYSYIRKLTLNYCIPLITPKGGDRFFILLYNKDLARFDNIDLNEICDTVRTARWIKDRFFFTKPIPLDVATDTNYITTIAWIPKDE